MSRRPRAIVEVFPDSALPDRPRLFAALAQALPVTFRPYSERGGEASRGDREADALVILTDGPGLEWDRSLQRGDVPVLVVGGDPTAAAAPEEIRLHRVAELDPTLRGISLHDRPVAPSPSPAAGETVLAEGPSGPVWTVSGGPAPIHQVRSVLSELEADHVLWSLLSRRAIAAVAVVQFLRAVVGEDFTRPALRATFMFDDPNLRWRSYGFLRYRRLVQHADEHGYHAAMAMVPADAGRAHSATAALFAGRRDRLSLLIHGNDHVREELWALTDPACVLSVAAQARRRIIGFEHRTGVPVDRVMTPPHGLCSREMARALTAVGFEALCTEHPLPWTDALPADRLMAAWRPADFVEGSVVIPRMPLESSDASIALRAFLRQPLVIYGHHGDVADGLDRLASVAAFVNAMGDVRWTSMAEIALTNHDVTVDGGHATVRPYARRVRLNLGPEVDSVTIEPPVDLLTENAFTGWSLPAGTVHPFGERTPVPRGGPLQILLQGGAGVDPDRVAPPPWRPWPRLRRGAAEVRDRAMPLVSAARSAATEPSRTRSR
jgi:hypothetical protein